MAEVEQGHASMPLDQLLAICVGDTGSQALRLTHIALIHKLLMHKRSRHCGRHQVIASIAPSGLSAAGPPRHRDYRTWRNHPHGISFTARSTCWC